ncbi:MAG: GNAT family N-acetyltransferase [Chloroflexi bacterium]|nr:GNAT family N-acetyltransferase [Chloroflexota bacterium]
MIKIRPETLSDYAAIARVNVRAFNPHVSVPLIVDLHRHRSRFDPELSLVAEVAGQIVGHVLFSPQTIRLMGQNVDVVNLSPLAVAPEHQRKGVGSALVTEGHRIAEAKGYPLSFLIGHPSYYPRFGYQQHAFGASSLKVSTSDFQERALETRLPTEADLPTLRDLWLHEEGDVDFAIYPGDDLLDWISPNPAIKSLVYTIGGVVFGYARVEPAKAKAHMFLARDQQAARAMARQIGEEVELPLHINSASAEALGETVYSLWDAAMVCTFAPSPFEAYFAQIQARKRAPGRPLWGVEFELE